MRPSQLNPNENPDKDDLALSKVIERNIRTVIHLRTKDAEERSPLSRVANAIGAFLGRMVFVCIHIAWLEIHRLQAIESSKR